MATVKVGEKGQIVIPKEIREMFEIGSGDTLLLLADVERGLAVMPPSFCKDLTENMMSGKGPEMP